MCVCFLIVLVVVVVVIEKGGNKCQCAAATLNSAVAVLQRHSGVNEICCTVNFLFFH